MTPIVDSNTLVVSISQSGETMDTLMAVRYAREQGAKTISICNTNGSTIPRESDAVLYTHAVLKLPLHPPRHSWRRSQRRTCWACTWPSCGGATSSPARSRMSSRTSTRSRPRSRKSWTTQGPPARARPQHEGREVRPVPGPPRGLPGSLEGALKLKEIAYIHAEASPPASSSTVRSP